MTSPTVKATMALEKPPAEKPSRSTWIPDEDNKLRVNVSYKKVPRQFMDGRPENSPYKTNV
jgi:hypothetical protein